MDDQIKSKEQLIVELHELQLEHSSLKAKAEADLLLHKHTEAELRASEERFQLLFHKAPICYQSLDSEKIKSKLFEKLSEAQQIALLGSWEWNLQTNEVWWSDETYSIFGLTRQDFIPSFEANEKIIHPDDLDKYIKTFAHALKTGKNLDEIFRIISHSVSFL